MQASTTISPGVVITGLLPCPTGKKAVGGGWRTANDDPRFNVVGSAPVEDGTAWRGGMYNTGQSTPTVTLYVICATMQ